MTTPFDPFIEVERHGRIRVTKHVKFLVEKDRREACPQRTPEWYEKRRNHLTASSVASACGENPYENMAQAIKKKCGLSPGFQGNEATEHGNKYEDVARDLYERRTGEKVIEFGLLESIKGEGTDFLAGSPDGITASGRLLEIKCPFRRMPNGTIPHHYVFQVQTLMHILDLEVCDFVEYIPETLWMTEVFSIVTVRRDQEFWDKYFPRMCSFWQEVLDVRAWVKTADVADVVAELDKDAEPPKRKRAKKEPVCAIDPPEDDEGEVGQEDEKWCFPASFAEALAERVGGSGEGAAASVGPEPFLSIT